MYIFLPPIYVDTNTTYISIVVRLLRFVRLRNLRNPDEQRVNSIIIIQVVRLARNVTSTKKITRKNISLAREILELTIIKMPTSDE